MRVDAMTTHYIDMRVIPDPETSAPQLLGVLYGRLHQILVQLRLDSIGVSFPQYSLNPRGLGNVLRLHGSATSLGKLLEADWLKGVRDHVRITEINSVPVGVKHRTVRRKQFKTSAERLRRRRMRRKGETVEQARESIPSTMERRPDLPYIHLRSQSTGQGFCLFITLGPLQDEEVYGSFNSYALGGSTTIPWF